MMQLRKRLNNERWSLVTLALNRASVMLPRYVILR
jgi:hypothetical protein